MERVSYEDEIVDERMILK